jgi:hypothetical protein
VGDLAPVVIDDEAADRLEADVKALAGRLGNYANGLEDVDPDDREVVASVDAPRRAFEATYQQRINYAGEQREPSGPVVEGRIDVGEVAGYVAAVRAKVIEGGHVTGTVEADVVEEGGEAIAVDAERIGPSPGPTN